MWDEDRYGAEDEHRTLRTAVRVVLISLVVALAAVLVAPNLIDWNRYKPEVEARLERATGRHVKINGDLDFTILWTPALMAGDVEVANVEGGEAPDLLRLQRLDVRVDFFPLFTGKVKVSSLRLVEPVLVVEAQADGRVNLARPANAPPPSENRALGIGWFRVGPDAVSVDQVAIERGTLVYHDLKGKWSETLTGVTADFGLPTLDGPYAVKGAFDWRKRRYDLTANAALPQEGGKRPLDVKIMQTDTGLALSLVGRVASGAKDRTVSGALTLRVAEPAALFGMGAQGGPPAALAFDSVLTADTAHAELTELVAQWGELAATGQAAAKFEAPWTALVTLKGHQLNLDTLWPAPEAKDAPEFWPLALIGPSSVSPAAQADNGVFAAWRVETDLTLDGAFLHKGLVEAVHVRGIYTPGTFTLTKASAGLPGDTDMQLTGKLTRTPAGLLFDGDAALAGAHARDFCAWLGLDVDGVPAARLKTFAYRGGLGFGGGKVTFRDFEAGLDGGRATGRLTVVPGTRIRIDGDLAVTRLNLDPYAPVWRVPTANDQAPLPVQDDFALAPILAAVDRADGALKLTVDSLTWRQVQMTGLSADLAHEGDTLTIRNLSIANLDGAHLVLTGQGTKLAQAATLTADLKLDGNDMAPALVLAGVLSDTDRAVLGPGLLDVKATLTDGSGQVSATGQIDSARVAYSADLAQVERPLLGVLGTGHLKTKLELSAPNAADLARPFGFAAPKAAPKAPLAGTLMLTREVSPESANRVLDVRAGEAIMTGHLTRTGQGGAVYDGALSIKLPDVARLLASLGAEMPQGVSPGEALVLQVAGKGPEAAVVLSPVSFSFGKEEATGEGGLDLSGTLPRLDLGVKATTLDLDRLGALWRAWNGRSALPGWSESPLPFESFGKLDGTLNAEAQSLHIFGLDFATPHFSAKLANGNLQFTDGRATIFGGPMTANWALLGGSAAPGFALSLKFIDADGKAVSQALWGAPVLSGPLDGAFTLQATGVSERALAASLNGDVALRARTGTLHGFDLQGFEEARASLTAGDNPDRALSKLGAGMSGFRAIDIKSDVEGGVARITEGAAEFDSGDGPLGGSLDAVNQTLALTLGLPAKETEASAVLTLNGPLATPKRLLDTKALRAQLVKESSRRAEKLPPQPVPQVDQAPLAPPPGAPKALHQNDGALLNDAVGKLPAQQ